MRRNGNRLIDTTRLIPLSQDNWGAICSDCQKPAANWQWLGTVTGDDGLPVGAPICASCFLYESEWGKAQGAALPTLIREMEDGWGCKLDRNAEGHLASTIDANRVLAALAYLSYTMQTGVGI